MAARPGPAFPAPRTTSDASTSRRAGGSGSLPDSLVQRCVAASLRPHRILGLAIYLAKTDVGERKVVTFNVHEAKTNLSRLLARVEAGEDVIIARNGKPVARLVGYRPKGKRQPGVLKGKIVIPDSFFDPLPEEELALWEGRGDDGLAGSGNNTLS